MTERRPLFVYGAGGHGRVVADAALGADVTLEDQVHVGLGAVVLPGIRVGARSVVGAGAVVIEDVPEDVTVVGVPARRTRAHRAFATRGSSR